MWDGVCGVAFCLKGRVLPAFSFPLVSRSKWQVVLLQQLLLLQCLLQRRPSYRVMCLCACSYCCQPSCLSSSRCTYRCTFMYAPATPQAHTVRLCVCVVCARACVCVFLCVCACAGTPATRRGVWGVRQAHGLATILLNHRNNADLADKYFQRAVQGADFAMAASRHLSLL